VTAKVVGEVVGPDEVGPSDGESVGPEVVGKPLGEPLLVAGVGQGR